VFSSKHKTNAATGVTGCAQVVSEKNGRGAGRRGKGLYRTVQAGLLSDALGNAVLRQGNHRGCLHAAQHLAKRAVQTAQPPLERNFALAVALMCRGRAMDMRGGVRERNLLREQQQKNADPSQKNVLQVINPAFFTRTGGNLSLLEAMRNWIMRGCAGAVLYFFPR